MSRYAQSPAEIRLALSLLLLITVAGGRLRAEGSQEDLKEPHIDVEQQYQQQEWSLTYPIDLEDDSPLEPRIPVTIIEPVSRMFIIGEDLWHLFALMGQLDKVCGYAEYGDLASLTPEEVLTYRPELIISRYQLSGYMRGGLSARGIQTYHIGPLASKEHGIYHILNLGIICNESEKTEALARSFQKQWTRAGSRHLLWSTYLAYLKN